MNASSDREYFDFLRKLVNELLAEAVVCIDDGPCLFVFLVS